MGNFAQFYQDGGLFMHFVTLSALAAAVYTIRSISLGRRVTPTSDRTALARAMDLAAGYVGLALAMGVLGTLMGLHQTAAAIQGAPDDQVIKAIMRGVSISLNTATFGLMLAIPLGLAALFNRASVARRLAVREY